MTRTASEPIVRLTEDESWSFVGRHHLGRVAFARVGQPEVFPVNYVLDGRRVVFRSAPGTTLAMARAGARVAFEVDEASELFETGTSVVVHGTLHELVGDRDRLEHLPLRTWAAGRDHYVAVDAERISGRSIAPHQPDDGMDADGGT